MLPARLQLGDEVRWATVRAHRLNMPDGAAGRAWLPAYSDSPRPSCGDDAEFADFAVILDGDRLVGAVSAPVDHRFEEDRNVVPISIGHEPNLDRDRPTSRPQAAS